MTRCNDKREGGRDDWVIAMELLPGQTRVKTFFATEISEVTEVKKIRQKMMVS
jgi:hypothetical protein